MSMLVPSVALMAMHCHHPGQKLVLASALLHMPFGVAYHAGAALNLYKCPVDNSMRRLDQTVQHVVAVPLAYALSHGSWQFALLNFFPNAYWAWQIWMPRTKTKRWKWVGLSVALYTLPMLWRGDVGNYLLALSSMSAGGFLAFVLRCRWALTIFHLLLGAFAAALARSSSGLEAKSI